MKTVGLLAGGMLAFAALAAPVYDESGEATICFGSRVVMAAEEAALVNGVHWLTETSEAVWVRVRRPKPTLFILR